MAQIDPTLLNSLNSTQSRSKAIDEYMEYLKGARASQYTLTDDEVSLFGGIDGKLSQDELNSLINGLNDFKNKGDFSKAAFEALDIDGDNDSDADDIAKINKILLKGGQMSGVISKGELSLVSNFANSMGTTFKTSGGYYITSDFEQGGYSAKIYDPQGKEMSYIWGDPHVGENGGGWDFHFGDDSNFILPDGTKVMFNTLHWGGNVFLARGLFIQDGDKLGTVGLDLDDTSLLATRVTDGAKDFDITHTDAKNDKDGSAVFLWSNAANGGQGGWTVKQGDGKFYDVANEDWETYLYGEGAASFQGQTTGSAVTLNREQLIASLDGHAKEQFTRLSAITPHSAFQNQFLSGQLQISDEQLSLLEQVKTLKFANEEDKDKAITAILLNPQEIERDSKALLDYGHAHPTEAISLGAALTAINSNLSAEQIDLFQRLTHLDLPPNTNIPELFTNPANSINKDKVTLLEGLSTLGVKLSTETLDHVTSGRLKLEQLDDIHGLQNYGIKLTQGIMNLIANHGNLNGPTLTLASSLYQIGISQELIVPILKGDIRPDKIGTLNQFIQGNPGLFGQNDGMDTAFKTYLFAQVLGFGGAKGPELSSAVIKQAYDTLGPSKAQYVEQLANLMKLEQNMNNSVDQGHLPTYLKNRFNSMHSTLFGTDNGFVRTVTSDSKIKTTFTTLSQLMDNVLKSTTLSDHVKETAFRRLTVAFEGLVANKDSNPDAFIDWFKGTLDKTVPASRNDTELFGKTLKDLIQESIRSLISSLEQRRNVLLFSSNTDNSDIANEISALQQTISQLQQRLS
jgi:hypothetical protein